MCSARVSAGVVLGAGYEQVHVHVQMEVQGQALVQARGDSESLAFQVLVYILFCVYDVHVQVVVYFVCMWWCRYGFMCM